MSEQHEKLFIEISEDARKYLKEKLKENGYVTGSELLEAIGFDKRIGRPDPKLKGWGEEEDVIEFTENNLRGLGN